MGGTFLPKGNVDHAQVLQHFLLVKRYHPSKLTFLYTERLMNLFVVLLLNPEHDGSAEWNAYWDPEAVKIVFDSDIEIDMVALERYIGVHSPIFV
jgi:inosine-uridine nucleoside N-ribohydrolase